MTPVSSLLQQLNQIILGKEAATKLALTCLLAKGHLLIEDLPGMGKTTLSHALANSLGLSYQRIQFTSDLLPADLLGVNLFDRELGKFSFHPGPIFSQVVLADEINRATPKTQSALLEAMEESQVTIEGKTYPLQKPFFVIATQNPLEQAGTFPLPESQLDRFMMRISLGYPAPKAEKALLLGEDRRELLLKSASVVTPEQLSELQIRADHVKATESIIDYIQRLVQFSRQDLKIKTGLSPRAGMTLLRAARAWALIEGRQHVLPDDVQAVFPSVAEHRLGGRESGLQHPVSENILHSVDIF